MVRRIQLGMFKERNIGRSLCSQSKIWVLFSMNCKSLFQIENDADTSNFDFFAEDDAPEPEDDLTGWDKDF